MVNLYFLVIAHQLKWKVEADLSSINVNVKVCWALINPKSNAPCPVEERWCNSLLMYQKLLWRSFHTVSNNQLTVQITVVLKRTRIKLYPLIITKIVVLNLYLSEIVNGNEYFRISFWSPTCLSSEKNCDIILHTSLLLGDLDLCKSKQYWSYKIILGRKKSKHCYEIYLLWPREYILDLL